MGFLEKAVDIDNILADAEKSLDYFATVSIFITSYPEPILIRDADTTCIDRSDASTRLLV